MSTYHIYIDESGKFKFTPKGGKNLYFTAVGTNDPLPLVLAFRKYRYQLLKQGRNIEGFHAFNDNKYIRQELFDIIQGFNFLIYCLYVKKNKIPPSARSEKGLYIKNVRSVLKFMLIPSKIPTATDGIIILTDRLSRSIQTDQTYTLSEATELVLKKGVVSPIAYHLYHHASCSNEWLQVTDYCSWAIQRFFEQGDRQFYDLIQGKLMTPPFEATRRNTETYYEYQP
jgi:hypothetical protein